MNNFETFCPHGSQEFSRRLSKKFREDSRCHCKIKKKGLLKNFLITKNFAVFIGKEKKFTTRYMLFTP